MTDADPGFARLGEEIVHEGYAMSVAVARFGAPDGSEFTRDVIRHVGAVAVLPLHDDDTVTVVRQYRAPIDRVLVEIPAGLRDVSDEAPELTATRELAEEAGLQAERLEHLCSFHNAPGLSDEVVQVYRATGLTQVERDVQGPEETHMDLERHALDELVAMIRRGEVTDAKTVIGVLLTALR